MGEAHPAGRQAAEVTARPFRVASRAVAVALGALGLVLLAAWVALTFLTRDLQVSRDGAAAVFVVACGLLGMLVARHQPHNPEGWLLLGLAGSARMIARYPRLVRTRQRNLGSASAS